MKQNTNRRGFLRGVSGAAIAQGLFTMSNHADATESEHVPIIDTHQHLWDLSVQSLPWLADAPEILRQSYVTSNYLEATAGLGLNRAIYMEVDVDPAQHVAEAELILDICRDPNAPTVAAVIGGRPASADFADYIARFQDQPEIKGVRQVLHSDEAPQGFCLSPEFIKGVTLLGEAELCFDLCLRPTELSDGIELAKRCPGTRFVLDHCGNADPKAFSPKPIEPWHDRDPWIRDIEAFSECPNVICKISGIVARTTDGWTASDLRPIVNHCLDSFGPDRVIFGGDWPVCLLGSSYRRWVEALRSIVATRPIDQRRKLFAANAERFYGLS